MVKPEDCPSNWEYNPSDVRVKTWSDIPLLNLWKHKDSGEIVLQYKTITTVSSNNYVEKHSDPQTVKSRLGKLKKFLSQSDAVDVELDKVAVTGGSHISSNVSTDEALSEALRYMERNA